MQASMESGEMEQMDEDIAMLRQILDNLLAYSFSQENVMKEFRGLKRGSLSFNKNLKIQQDLKQQFKHVDDSLFAVSYTHLDVYKRQILDIHRSRTFLVVAFHFISSF